MVEHKALSLGDGGELNELIMQRNGKEWEWMERFKGVGVDEHRDQAEFLEGGQQPGMSFFFFFFPVQTFPRLCQEGGSSPASGGEAAKPAARVGPGRGGGAAAAGCRARRERIVRER